MNLQFKIIILCLTLPSIIHSTSLYSPDKSRELMIYEQNLNEIFDGEHQYIGYKYGKFSILEIYEESYDVAILYLHGRGLSPNEQNLAYPVRVGMSDSYNTYSLQLPVLK